MHSIYAAYTRFRSENEKYLFVMTRLFRINGAAVDNWGKSRYAEIRLQKSRIIDSSKPSCLKTKLGPGARYSAFHCFGTGDRAFLFCGKY